MIKYWMSALGCLRLGILPEKLHFLIKDRITSSCYGNKSSQLKVVY